MPRYGLPRYAPVRALLRRACASGTTLAWGQMYCRLPAAGPGQPELVVHVRKPVEDVVESATEGHLSFRFDESAGAGFGVAALKQKFGYTRWGDAGAPHSEFRVTTAPDDEGRFWASKTDKGYELAVRLRVEDQDGGDEVSKAWGYAPLPAGEGAETEGSSPTQGGSKPSSPARTHSCSDEPPVPPEIPDCLLGLHTTGLKVVAVLFALTDGGVGVNVARDDLFNALRALHVTDPATALQKARLCSKANIAAMLVHDGGAGEAARLALTQRGADFIRNSYANGDGGTDRGGLAHAMATVRALDAGRAPPPSPELQPPPQKRARTSAPGSSSSAPPPPPAGAPADADGDGLAQLEARLERLAARFERDIDQDLLGEEYGRLAAEHFKEHGAVPSAEESSALLGEARTALASAVVVGSGKVRLAEVVNLCKLVRAAKSLPTDVKRLEARMA